MSDIGLDIGSTEFRSIRYENGRLIGRRVPACYCVLDDQSTNRQLLRQAQIEFSVAKESLVVIGQAAIELSTLIKCPVIPVIFEGTIPWEDPVGRQVCVMLVESLAPQVHSEHSKCTIFSSEFSEKGKLAAPSFFERILQLRGYQVSQLDAATAVVLAELQEFEFSGLSIVIGAESIAFSLTHLGKPVFKDVFGHGFRSIEQRFALKRHRYHWDAQGNQYLNLISIRSWLQSSGISLTQPQNGDEAWIADEFKVLVKNALDSIMADLIRASRRGEFRNRLPVVISGGPTKLTGVPTIIADALYKCGVPIKALEVSTASHDPYSVARGLLVNSLLESETVQREVA